MRGLGRIFDVGTCFTPVDMADGDNTGHRVHMRNYGAIAICGYFTNGTAAEAPTITVQEHTANTGGTSADLAVVTQFYTKSEAELDGDETWTEVTQSAAATVTNALWDDALEVLVVIEVEASALSDGYEWISANVADTGTAQLGCMFYIMHDLKIQRNPALLAQPNA